MRKLLIAFLFGALMFSSCEFALAEDLVKPVLDDTDWTILSEHYSPSGGALLFVDATNDGVCDAAIMYGLLGTGTDHATQVYTRSTTCEIGTRVLETATKEWEKAGLIPMIYDNNLKKLVPYGG